MPEYTYPSYDAQVPRLLLRLLGSFWRDTYGGRDQLLTYLASVVEGEQQLRQDLQEAVDSVRRDTVPVYHREQWTSLVLKESELNATEGALLRFDEGAAFGHQPDDGYEYRYDVARREYYTFPAPDDLVDYSLITNRMTDPSVVWARGLDFVTEQRGSLVVFRRNPFEHALIPVVPVWDGGEVVDRECQLWVFRGGYDYKHIYEHFGYVLGLQMESNEAYRVLVDAALESLVEGPTQSRLERMLEAMTDAPAARSDGEVVVDVSEDRHQKIVATDAEVYLVSSNATVTVSEGDVLRAGQPVSDAWEIHTPNDGTFDDAITGLSLDRGYLAAGYLDALQFVNEESALTITEAADDPTGYTRIEFPVGGHPLDVEKFFNDLHTRGIQRGKTLAHLLDTRTNQVGEPTALVLPSTINPLQLLAQSVLRSNLFLVQVRASSFGADALGLSPARLLRRILPPHTAMILRIELQQLNDSATMADIDSERITYYSGIDNQDDAGGTPDDSGRITARTISGTCQ